MRCVRITHIVSGSSGQYIVEPGSSESGGVVLALRDDSAKGHRDARRVTVAQKMGYSHGHIAGIEREAVLWWLLPKLCHGLLFPIDHDYVATP